MKKILIFALSAVFSVFSQGTGAANALTDNPRKDSNSVSIVSVSYDPSITYGEDIVSADPEDKPLYRFIWDAILRLNLGDETNPLSKLISPGDRVLIKINLIGTDKPFYTRPEILPPIIEMCKKAGASVVEIADGSNTDSYLKTAFKVCGYEDMAQKLRLKYPDMPIHTLSLNQKDDWRWVALGNNSLFFGSGYKDTDLFSFSKALFKSKYYSTRDTRGVDPRGYCLGWYAVNSHVLDADVIINVPKLKVHRTMIMTGCIKSYVGCVVSSTYDDSNPYLRIAHSKKDSNPRSTCFDNDVFWRSIGDINRIVLYADKNGILRQKPQRKVLNVVDGIESAEKGHSYKKKHGHSPESKGSPYPGKILLAGTDPLAVDAVACRMMGYDFRAVKSIIKNGAVLRYPLGTCDPGRILVLGKSIDGAIGHVYDYSVAWGKYAEKNNLIVSTFTPPAINAINSESKGGYLTVTANIGDTAVAAYILYVTDGQRLFTKMKKKKAVFTAKIPAQGVSECALVAQDRYFNSVFRAIGIQSRQSADIRRVGNKK